MKKEALIMRMNTRTESDCDNRINAIQMNWKRSAGKSLMRSFVDDYQMQVNTSEYKRIKCKITIIHGIKCCEQTNAFW